MPNDAAEVRFTVSRKRRGRAAALRVVAAGVAAGATSTRGPNFFLGDRQ